MHSKTTAWAAAVAGCALCVALAGPIRAEDKSDAKALDAAAQAKQVWKARCSSCHTAPDASFETDRAFLRQITETT